MKDYHFTPWEMWGMRMHEGEKLGLEIEVEGNDKVPVAFASQSDCARYWTTHEDNSLRRRKEGDIAVEYVFRNPVDRDETFKALKALNDLVKSKKAELYDSYRTSVHVHVNMSDVPLLKSLNYVAIWTIVEDMLVEWCGKDRVGNRFCLRFKDADGIFLDIKKALTTKGNIGLMCSQDKRYAAMNIASLARFGSVEFRSMRGTLDQDVLEKWIDMLLDMRRAAIDFESPREIIDMFSGAGPDRLLARFFPRGVPDFIRNDSKRFEKMSEGMRLAQEIAYALPSWEPRVEPIKVAKPGPKKKQVEPFAAMPLEWDDPPMPIAQPAMDIDHLAAVEERARRIEREIEEGDRRRRRERELAGRVEVAFPPPLPGAGWMNQAIFVANPPRGGGADHVR